MLQVLQDLKSGATELHDVPAPKVRAGHVRIRTRCSLVSAGTERMLVEFGKANLIDKARQQPDRVMQVLDKVRTDGLRPTIEAVLSKLDQPMSMGYCNVGEVIEVGAGVQGLSVGDRVVSNSPHAEIVVAPKNLCARIPSEIGDDAAAFTVLGSIGLQGVRLLQPTLGERMVVMGLGLVGLLSAQILKAHGCEVLGTDFDPKRLELARSFGIEAVDASGGDVLSAAAAFSRGRGVDGVLICASTKSDDPMHLAAEMCRQRGRIVLVGVVGLDLARADFYEKELTFQVSCSYGPGRYDAAYEEQGHDYPVGFVRWTEQRNFEAVLDLMAARRLETNPLLTHRFQLHDAADAYEVLLKKDSLGILLEYPAQSGNDRALKSEVVLSTTTAPKTDGAPGVSFVGAGAFAGRFLIPAFKSGGAQFRKIASANGVSGAHLGKKFDFASSTTDVQTILDDPATDMVVVATRHDSHAGYVVRALNAQKAVFVEKPLAVTHAELDAVDTAYAKSARPFLMVGFNRRFSPHIAKMRELVSAESAKAIVITINSGHIPADHWTQDMESGGRIVGEGCHFVDLARYLAGAPITGITAVSAGQVADPTNFNDVTAATLRFANGSIATISYLASGHRAFPKERVEIFQLGRTLQLDNFRTLRGFGYPRFSKFRTLSQDKGHMQCAKATVDALKAGSGAPIPFAELMEVSRATLAWREAAVASMSAA